MGSNPECDSSTRPAQRSINPFQMPLGLADAVRANSRERGETEEIFMIATPREI
jgi:hypothetical protein